MHGLHTNFGGCVFEKRNKLGKWAIVIDDKVLLRVVVPTTVVTFYMDLNQIGG